MTNVRINERSALNPDTLRAEAARRRLPLYLLAVRSGTDPATLSRILNGKLAPSVKLVERLARVLRLPREALGAPGRPVPP